MKPKFSLRSFIALAGSSLLAMPMSFAATSFWTQTGAGPFDWSTTTNWNGSTIADGADFTASFAANITANQTINLDAARTIGNIVAGDGSHDYTISGANTLTLDRTGGAIPYINVTPAGRSLTISSVIAGNDGLDKWGAGQLNLNGSAVNTFTGGIKVSSGTLNLNFANLGTPTDLVNSGNTLTLGGGTLLITGNTATNTNQTLGNVTVNAGGGQILVNPNGASRTATLTLGSITPAATGTLLVGKSSGSSGTATITTTSGTLTNGIYGGNMVYFNGTANTGYDWATNTGGAGPAYTLTGLASYTAVPALGTVGDSTVNYQVTTTSTTLGGNFAVKTLKMAPNTTNSVVLDLGGNTLTAEGGGLLFTGSGTGNRINNGTVTAGAGSGYKLFIHNYNSQFSNTAASNPGIGAAITNNGGNAVAVVMTGNPGANLFELASTSNSFTGGLYLNNASVRLGAGAGTINNNTIYVSGYSVLYNPNFSNASSIELSDGAMLDFRNNVGTYTTSGAVTGKGGIVLGQAGGGRSEAVFNSTSNTFSGPVEYRVTPNAGQNGILSVNSIGDAEYLGSGDIRFGVAGTGTNAHIFNFGGSSGAPSGPLTFNNRRFELAGTHLLSQINNNTAQNFTINTDLLVTATAAQSLTLGGTGAGISTYVGKIGDNPVNAAGVVSITKAGASVWTLSGNNTYTGNTFVDAGTLTLNDDAQLRFVVTGNGVNNFVYGDATIATFNINGDFMFDLSLASVTLGDSWNIVNIANLNETFSGTFQALSLNNGLFSESAGLWTIAENGVGYEFSELTGVLTVVAIPEPGVALLGGLGVLLLLRRRRS